MSPTMDSAGARFRARIRPTRCMTSGSLVSAALAHPVHSRTGGSQCEEDIVSTPLRSLLLLATAVALAAAPASAQSRVAVAFDSGPLFTGIGFGAGYYDHGSSVFVGVSLGTYHAPAYGIYDVYSYSAPVHTYVSYSSCWDRYWHDYWSPWPGWYDACVAYGPVHYSSFRVRSWLYRSTYYAPRYVYVRDPYVAPWGPYWAYDPWGSYWTGYRDGWFDGRRTRTVYAYGGRTGYAVYRPSPLALASTSFKENPSAGSARTARRRAEGAAPASTSIAS